MIGGNIVSMSILGFTLRALALSPQVFLRYLPALVIYLLLVVGLFLSTDNPWVIGMILVIMGTYGASFLIVTGIRAGLMSARATTAPTVEGLMKVSGRLMVTHLLLQVILVASLTLLVAFIFYRLILPEMAPAAITMYEALRAEVPPPPETLPDPVLLAESLRLPMLLFNIAMGVIGGLCIGIFGVPMAAMAANAVQYSPQHDVIYGLGRYFPHQMFLYLVALALPSALFALYAPASTMLPEDFSFQALGVIAIGSAVYSVYAPAIVFAGMALSYKQVRSRVEAAVKAERVPDIDYDAERENLRSLRLERADERSVTTTYDPREKRSPAARPVDMADGESGDEKHEELRRLRRSRATRVGGRPGTADDSSGEA